jgi:hypothetical protein
MTNKALTNDERRCLQMWFRQAISQVEREEATQRILAEQEACRALKPGHSSLEMRPRPTRRPAAARSKELAI